MSVTARSMMLLCWSCRKEGREDGAQIARRGIDREGKVVRGSYSRSKELEKFSPDPG